MKPLVFLLSVMLLAFSLKAETFNNSISCNRDNTNKIQLDIKTSEKNELLFNVSLNEEILISDSAMGFELEGDVLGKNVEITKREKKSVNESYHYYGNHAVNKNVYHEVTYSLKESSGRTFYLDTRTYPDGIAFRYRIPTESPVTVKTEKTSFNFPSGTQVWYASGPFQYGWLQIYQNRLTDDITGELLAPPATFKLPNGVYAAITESNLTHFHGAVLFGVTPNQVKIGFVENEGHLKTGIPTGVPEAKYYHSVVRDVPWLATPKDNEIKSPWRILMLSKDLNGLVNNDMVSNLADKPDPTLFPQGEQTEWIKPGRSAWTWFMRGNKNSLDTYRKYIRGAQELGLEYLTIDEGWERWEQTEKETNGKSKWDMLKDLADYGRERGVGLWVWRPSSPRYGKKTDIGLEDPEERKNFIKNCAEAGVKGIKIDFFHTENVHTVDLMETILRDAAKEKLLVVFHGVNKPTGDSRTYPNLLAKEAVRGLECVGGENSWAPGPPWPYHDTVLPFTRWLAGPADYTPLNFRGNCHPSVTFAHQTASMYILTSPMLILGADMEDMLDLPCRDFVADIPVSWDETIVLPESSIGKLASFARRKGDVWYLSVLNGEEELSLETSLDFLPEGEYEVKLLLDAPDNRKLLITKILKMKSGQKLKENLLSGGGLVARFKKI